MKLAIIHNHPIHYKHLLFQELTKLGIDFEVVFLAGSSEMRHERIPLSPELYRYRIGFDGAYESAPPLSRLTFTWRAVSNIRPDIMIISGYHAIECWAAWIWARIHGCPIIMWYESNEFDYVRRWYKEFPKKVFVRSLTGAHVYGLSNKAYLVKLGMKPDSITLKRAVVDLDKFLDVNRQRYYSQDDQRRLIYVGRLAPEKNLSFLLGALAKANSLLRRPALFLTIAGTGPLEGQLRKECAELNIQQNVEFTGYCPQQQLRSLYLKSDFLVLPSLREPWGLVSLEAMLCGLPVLLSTQCGCAKDLITPDTGWSFSPFQEAAFAELLATLPEIPTKRIAYMGDCAREVAREYSAPSCAERIMRSLDAIQCDEVLTGVRE